MAILNDMGYVDNPSARIQFLQVAQTSPGQCGICGTGQAKEGFADTQLDFEYWGRLILCRNCTAQIAAVFGFIAPADYEEMLGELDLTKLNLNEALGKVKELESIVDSFNSYWARSRNYTTGLVTDDEAFEEPKSPEQPTISEPNRVDEEPIREQQSTPKPTRKQGLLNL